MDLDLDKCWEEFKKIYPDEECDSVIGAVWRTAWIARHELQPEEVTSERRSRERRYSLTDLILKRAELPPPHEHTAMAVYAGHEAENRILLPLIRSLCAELEAAHATIFHHLEHGPYGEWDLMEPDQGYDLKQALQRLEQFRKGMEK